MLNPHFQIYEDPNLVDIKVVVRGIADKCKPNRKKPWYRKVIIKTPKKVYYQIGTKIICHPVMAEKLREAVKQRDRLIGMARES